MNDARSRRTYRRIARLLPSNFRATAGAGLEDAALACLERERARRGRTGVAFAWLRLAADALATSTLERVTRRPAGTRPTARRRLEACMDTITSDLRHALRQLRRQPGFTLVSVLTLALGIGANTAIFSVVNGVLLRQLPYPDPTRLDFITTEFPLQSLDEFWVSLPEFVEFRDHNRSYTSVVAYVTGAVNLGTATPTRPQGAQVSPELMPTLGVRPIAGRWFTPVDSQPGAEPVAVLSSELWQTAFGRDPGVLDRRVTIDGISTRIVGIMPPGYDIHAQKVEIWQPLSIDPSQFPDERSNHFLYLVGRRRPGISIAEARADLPRMYREWLTYAATGAQHSPNVNPAKLHLIRIDPLKDDIIGSVQRALVVLQGAVLLVLVIACANLASLLLARADAREREFAVRSAIGAGRGRLFAQFVVEGLVLATLGAGAGVGVTALALRGMVTIGASAIPLASDITLDARVLTFTLVLTVVTGLVFGLAPLFHLGPAASIALRDGTRTSRGGGRRLRNGLVVAEVALAVMLTTGAGLLIRSLVNLMHVDPGFNRSQLVTFEVVPPVLGSPKTLAERQGRRQHFVDLFESIRERLAALPGVERATATSGLPPDRQVNASDADIEWIPNTPPGQPFDPKYPIQNIDYWTYVTRDFVRTLGVPVLRGRGFEAADVSGGPVALVNEALVHKFFFDRNPIGQRLKPGFGDDIPWFTIVGVLGDMKQGGLDKPAGTELFLLEDQLPRYTFITTDMNFVVRTTAPLSTLAGPIRQIVRDLDSTLPVSGLQTMDDVFGDALARPRFLTLLLGMFAGLALVLAAVGTYGILSYLVGARRQEIGIRMALGADRPRILRQVFTRGAVLAGTGLGVGVVGALGLTRLMRTLLFDVAPTDPITLTLVVSVIGLVACAACLVPAFRATRIEPLVVLRQA